MFNEYFTAQKMKFSIKDFLSKCDQIRSFLWIWSRLLKKSLMENFIFCVVFGNIVHKLGTPIEKSNIELIELHLDEVNMAIIKYKTIQPQKILKILW